MNRLSRTLLPAAASALAILTGVTAANAHNWGCWRQPNRTVPAYVTASLSSQAIAAVSEWDTKTILAVPRVGSHTEISVFDGYYGNTGWAGLASIESYSGCNILHGHARVNRSYSYTSNGYRGIFCQEVGHLFGLDHSNDGGCMGGGYFYSINTYYTVVQHNINDIATKYSGVPLMAEPSPGLVAMSPLKGEGPLSGEIPEGSAKAVAFWHDRPTTLDEAVDRSQAVVVGRVMQILPGADLVVPVEGLKNGEDRIPTQRILVSVEQVLSGRLKGRVIELFRTGNDTYTMDEDPSYAVGERYVLFLTPKDHLTYRVIAPEGRLKVTESGLVPSAKREFMSELRGRSVEALGRDLARLAPVQGSDDASMVTSVQLRLDTANPFGSRTSIPYALPQASDGKRGVYDAQGRVVRTLVDGHQEGGRWFTVDWNGLDDRGQTVSNGVFFAKLETAFGLKSVSLVRLQ